MAEIKELENQLKKLKLEAQLKKLGGNVEAKKIHIKHEKHEKREETYRPHEEIEKLKQARANLVAKPGFFGKIGHVAQKLNLNREINQHAQAIRDKQKLGRMNTSIELREKQIKLKEAEGRLNKLKKANSMSYEEMMGLGGSGGGIKEGDIWG